jgi:hypothetical protein
MKLGIENLKKIADIGLVLGNFTSNLIEGEKASWVKVLATLPNLVLGIMGSVSVFKDLEQVKLEFVDLDEAEKEVLVSYIEAKLEVSNEKAKKITIIAFELVFKALEIVDVLKK